MKIGIARCDVTPTRPVWMAGFAARNRPSEGAYQEIFAKALALDDGSSRAVVVTADVLFFDDLLQGRIEARLRGALGLQPREVILTASHTHSGPAINEREWPIYPDFDREYAVQFEDGVRRAVERAFGDMRDGDLAFGVGHCEVGINRRLMTPQGAVTHPNPEGPFDPEIAVLRAGGAPPAGDAVVMSYACHPSTWDGYLIGGEYPGFAQKFIEERHSGAQAMFVQGCGGDTKARSMGPDGGFHYGSLENVERQGREFADAVSAVLAAPMQPVAGALDVRRVDFGLPLDDPPTRAEAEAALRSSNPWQARWAQRMLAAMERGEGFPRTCLAMVQVLTIGDFRLVALSGEVGVEIGLRIKRMFAGSPVMVAAYAGPTVNTDYVMPKHRFPEGGYEVNGNYFYTLLPAPLRPEAEDVIIEKVSELAAGGR